VSEKRGRIVFVVGGAKSGKSFFALAKAETFAGRKAFIATAESLDDEMKERIRRHRDQRGKEWETFEEPKEMARVLREIGDGYGAALIDCLTLWLSNLLHSHEDPDREIDSFLSVLREGEHPPFFIVSNEVGMGIVPDNALSRRFRDLAGRLNQEVATIADEVYLVTAGIPLRIKP
jgi:adenosylcobinamide kinase/adenosylcobinamide-phosphate guanylyltransferase